MEFLKDIALPQSAEHIQLLYYILILILFLFIPFVSAVFGGTVLSVYYKKKEKISLDKNYRKFSQDIIELVTINKNVGLILGIVPLFTVILIFSQIFQSNDNLNLIFLGISFILFIIAFNYVYDYRNSFRYLGNVDLTSGKIAIVFLFFALWFFSTGISAAVFSSNWQSDGIINTLFSPIVVLRFLFLLVSAVAITGGAVLFGIFYLDNGKRNYSEDYGNFVRRKIVKVTLTSTILLPLFIFANLLLIPGSSLSGAVFVYIVIGLFSLFLAYHFLYMIFARFSTKFTALLFISLLFMVLTVIINDQLVISNSTKVSSAVLAVQYDELMADMKGEGPVVLSGKEIYQTRCAACHKFDGRLVGPPYNEVVPKYFDNEEELIAFIKRPSKIDPNYPPMPNPGLRPNEVKAVAGYVLEQVKKNVGK